MVCIFCGRKKLYFPDEQRKSASSRHEPKISSDRGLESLGRAVLTYQPDSTASSTETPTPESKERRLSQRESVAALVKDYAAVAVSCDRKRAELRVAWAPLLREIVKGEILRLSVKNFAKDALNAVISGEVKS